LHDRPAIVEYRQLVRLAVVGKVGTYHEPVCINRAVAPEPNRQFLEVELHFVLPMRELHGIAAAERGRAGAHLAVQELEVTMLAALAVALLEGAANFQLMNGVSPQVDVEHRWRDAVQVAGEDLKRLDNFEVRNYGNDGAHDTCR